MSGLFGSLTSAARALEAQRYGLDVVGQNIANANTPAYARRAVDLVAVPPNSGGSAGQGVDVGGVRSLRDRLVERRLHQELPAERREAAIAESLAIVEIALGEPGQSIDGSLRRLFDAFSRLAESPTSAVARQEVVLQGESLATAFRDMAGRFEAARRDADLRIRSAVDEVNGLATRIAALNNSMGEAASGAPLHLQDEQSALVRQLSEIVGIEVIERPEGGVDLTFGSGRALVIGGAAYEATAAATGPAGYAQVTTGGMTVTSELRGGRLGGFLQVRDVNIPDYVARLDELAYETVQQVNVLHTAGFDQTGAAAGNFFDFSAPPAGTAGAAAAMILDPALAGDPRRVAAGSTADSGDNQTARTIAALRDARVIDGGTASLNDAWSQIVYRAGRDTRSAKDEARSRLEIVRQVDALRDATSGVSLDEEAMQMLKYQRAYEANARFFQIVDRVLDNLLQMVGR